MIRIVVVDDSPEVISNIERLLYFEPDIEVVGTANDGEVGYQVVRETRPDVVLLDINMPGMDGLTAAQAITSSLPGIQVIMMSIQDDMEYVRRAMLAGARDYVLKPLDIDEVPAKVRQVHGTVRVSSERPGEAAPEEAEPGQVVTVFGPRGGCGCTTIAINLALALRAFTRRKVVIVDGALQFGDVAVMLNLHDQRNIAELARHVDEMDAAFANDMTVAHSSGVRALLAPRRPEMAELVTGECMRRTLSGLSEKFDFVVLDGGHQFTEAILAAIDETDRLLLVTTPDIPSIKSTRLMLEVLDALEALEDQRHLVISQAGRRYGVKAEDVERSLGMKALACLPYDEAGPLLAANQGRPMYEMDPETPLCRALLELGKSVTGGTKADESVAEIEKPKPRKMFSFLGKA